MTLMTPTTGSESHTHSGFLEPIFRSFSELAARIRRYNELARAEAHLRALSDHELSDIGINRLNIHERVWEGFKSH